MKTSSHCFSIFVKTVIAVCTLAVILFPSQGISATDVHFEEDHTLPMVYLNIVFRSGSTEDPSGMEGLASATNTALLRGTQRKTKSQIDSLLDDIGARMEVETRSEFSVFRTAVLSRNIDTFFALLQEVLTQPSFQPHEVRKLLSQMQSSLLERLSSDSWIGKRRFEALLFSGHPYGLPIDGTLKSLEKLTDQAMRNHHLRIHARNRLVITGTGDLSSNQIEKWAEKLKNALPETFPLKALLPPTPIQKPRIVIIDKPNRTQTQVYIGKIGPMIQDPNHYPLNLGNFVFGGGSFSSTLMTEIRVKRGWSYGANSSFLYGTQPRSWFVHFFPAAKDTPAAIQLAYNLIHQIKTNGITEERFQFAQRSLVNGAGFGFNTPNKRIENLMLESVLGLPSHFFEKAGEEFKKVTLSQVNQTLRDFIEDRNLVTVIVGTASELKEPLSKALQIEPNSIEVLSYKE